MSKSRRKPKKIEKIDNIDIYRSIRKPMPKPSRPFKDKGEEKWNWREELVRAIDEV